MGRGVVVRCRAKNATQQIDYELDPEYTLDEVQQDINEAIEGHHNVQLVGTDGALVGGPDGLDLVEMAVLSVMDPEMAKPKQLGSGS